jgi:hypothetical protein
VYNYSIFGALESRDYKRIKYQYFIPQTLSFATPGFPAVLFGKVDLSYTPSFVDTCLNFFPPQFFERLKIMPNLERKTYDPNFYKSVLDLMIETIAVFVNSSAKDDRRIVERLVLLSSDEFRYDIADIQSEHAFYVFPIIGFVLMKMIESISSDKFSDLNNKPEAS